MTVNTGVILMSTYMVTVSNIPQLKIKDELRKTALEPDSSLKKKVGDKMVKVWKLFCEEVYDDVWGVQG